MRFKEFLAEADKRVYRVPKGTMPKAELSPIGKGANPEKGKIAKREKEKMPWDYPGDDALFGHCNYDKRIVRRKKGERVDPDYLGDILHFVHEHDGKLFGIGSDNKRNPTPLGTVKVVGKTMLQNPMTEEWVDAQTLEVHMPFGAIIPATRLGPRNVISQDYDWKAYVPSGWAKIKNAMRAVAASPKEMDEILRDLGIDPNKEPK